MFYKTEMIVGIDDRTDVRYNNSRFAIWSYFILLNRPINIFPGIGGVNDNGT